MNYHNDKIKRKIQKSVKIVNNFSSHSQSFEKYLKRLERRKLLNLKENINFNLYLLKVGKHRID